MVGKGVKEAEYRIELPKAPLLTGSLNMSVIKWDLWYEGNTSYGFAAVAERCSLSFKAHAQQITE